MNEHMNSFLLQRSFWSAYPYIQNLVLVYQVAVVDICIEIDGAVTGLRNPLWNWL